ncbi:hypothetical protein GCM10027275_34880 [Rhabdobacter roseus]|uniref:Uncharacterized protein n=1 Tax=Rhabdobacter roseus TaxID=1655419 RepID=A0A840TNK9_9BACT|nr:hypothetical protein [Rhabdobacter roseus]MBB5285291.1 hypothetical protein [Rhabdobacter roseus]
MLNVAVGRTDSQARKYQRRYFVSTSFGYKGWTTLIKLHATTKKLRTKMIRDDGEVVVGPYTLKRK